MSGKKKPSIRLYQWSTVRSHQLSEEERRIFLETVEKIRPLAKITWLFPKETADGATTEQAVDTAVQEAVTTNPPLAALTQIGQPERCRTRRSICESTFLKKAGFSALCRITDVSKSLTSANRTPGALMEK